MAQSNKQGEAGHAPAFNGSRGRLLRVSLLPLSIWTVLVAISLFLNLWHLNQTEIDLAAAEGNKVFRMIEAMRLWNAEHGGIFVVQTPRDPPNPYLIHPERSTATVTGKPLTLLNPAYMTRQMAEVLKSDAAIRIHLTSLKLLNPGNKASDWEARALELFEREHKPEVIEIVELGDVATARYMAPLFIKPACLKCHAQQGYKVGDVRGGISVEWPIEPLALSIQASRNRDIATHIFVWLLVGALMVLGLRQLMLRAETIRQSRDALKQLNANLERTVAERTEELTLAKQSMETISAVAPALVYQFRRHPDGTFSMPFANERLADYFGLRPEVVRDDVSALFERVLPEDIPELVASTEASAKEMKPWHHQFRVRDPAGRIRWLEGNTVPQEEKDGSVLWSGFITDITERCMAEEVMKLHKVVIDNALDGFWRADAAGNLLETNRAYAAILGYAPDELLTMNIRDLEVNEAPEEVSAHMQKIVEQGSDRFETRHRHRDGHLVEMEVAATFMHETQQFFVFARDIGERKQLERAMHSMAFHDALTGLPNRRLLSERLARMLASCKRSGRHGALLFLDLDNFKPLNDMSGHDVGDRLLQQTAARLLACVREVDTVARFGGDEFVIMLSDLDVKRDAAVEQAMQVAEKVRKTIAEPFELKVERAGGLVQTIIHACTASIGVVPFTGQDDEHGLLRSADEAMYRAKQAGRDRIYLLTERSS